MATPLGRAVDNLRIPSSAGSARVRLRRLGMASSTRHPSFAGPESTQGRTWLMRFQLFEGALGSIQCVSRRDSQMRGL